MSEYSIRGLYRDFIFKPVVHIPRPFLPLPPKVLLHLGPEGGEEVVEVHDDVDPHVQEPAERRVSPANKSINS